MQLSYCFLLVLVALVATPVWSRGVRVEGKATGLRGQGVNPAEFQKEIQNAIGAGLGCGGAVAEQKLKSIEKTLLPMWRSLPKNSYDRVERRSLRYLAHRYFMQQSAIMVRGFEPSRSVNSSSWGSEDILSQQVPAFVESVLESKRAEEHGFGLQDAVNMIAMLEQLISEYESTILEKVYARNARHVENTLSAEELNQIFEEYMIHWMLGDDTTSINILLKDRSRRETGFPHWKALVGFIKGQLSAMRYKRASTGGNGIKERFSFDEVHEVAGSVTESFSSFWESECQAMKMQLVDMDKHNTGRVPLSKFYGSGLDAEWRFGESEQYLRELGALDETSQWRGKQVIIPNYIQAASNCIVSTPHYLVCCVNDCESLLGDIESAVGAPVAPASELIALVKNMTAQTTMDDDAPAKISKALTKQLEEIAAANGGKVPLHGRLFAQWLHYVFPRDCPFPHKVGKVSYAAPAEFGEYLATSAAMKVHASNVSEVPAHVDGEQMQYMSQWSSEEELMADYAAHLSAPWEGRWLKGSSLLLFAIASLVGIVGRAKTAGGRAEGLLPMSSKSHYV